MKKMLNITGETHEKMHIFREMQIKITMKYDFTPIVIAIIK